MGRDHVVGEVALEVRAEVVGGGLVGDDVGDEAFVAGDVFSGDDGALGDLGVFSENGFDLAQLDPIAAELDLVIDAAEVLELAVLEPAGEVAAPVEPAAGGAVRVGKEAFRGQLVTVEVAAGDTGAPCGSSSSSRRSGIGTPITLPLPPSRSSKVIGL